MRRRIGTTLMELLMIILVISVMSSLAFPTVDSFYSNDQVTAAASNLTSDIRYARGYAIDNQCYIRLRFLSDGSGWAVEEAWDNVGDTSLLTEPTESHLYWESILDEYEREILPSVSMEFEPASPPVIYFSPDGLLRAQIGFSGAPIRRVLVKFFFGNAEAAVDLSPAGAIESQAWYNYDE